MYTIDGVVIIFYLAGMIVVGFILSKKQSSTEEYFLANRSISWSLIGLSILGSSISTISYLSFPGEIIANGPTLFLMNLVFPISYLIIAYVFLPVYFKYKVKTIFEYLEHRFNANVRLFGVIIFFFMRISWMAIIIYTASIAISSILNLPILIIILIIGLVTTIYTSLGGIRADILTDAVQTTILFLGGIVAIFIIIVAIKGFTPILDTILKEGQFNSPIISMDLTSILGVLIWSFFINIAVFGTDQVMVQRCFCTSSLKQARMGMLFNFIGNFIFGIILSLIGFALLSYFTINNSIIQDYFQGGLKENADKIFPFFISHFMPTGFSGLIIAALLAAAMSSLDSGINSTITVIQIDIRERYKILWTNVSSMKFIKITSVLLGLSITILALILPSIKGNLLQVSSKIAGLFEGPLSAIFLLGMISKRATPFGAILGGLTGVLAGVVLSYGDIWFGFPPVSFTWIIPFGTTIGFASGFIASKFR